ncbi:proline racemase family protein [Runella salmonicolor]|uniref:Proline racemase family protein n=1 Tax=Runella salmonicolor TaxID=2950278 RepID=A0ABT1FV54_9BACT|nr:proline racemase family protein [Runella salmonicolor]MCP1385650.1 proline racemase family protein [Runella salmonicolor]
MTPFYQRLRALNAWKPPQDWLQLTAIDAHTGGEPLRIITDGIPEIRGNTILERRAFLKTNLDHLRKALMWEPRGHADMYGCIVTEPVTKDADFGVIFLHNEGYSSMCGHGIIAVTKVAVELGLIEAKEPVTTVRIDSPAGLITAYANVKNGQITSVKFQNVPSFVLYRDHSLRVEGLGEVRFDVVYGGAFYAYVDADALGIGMTTGDYRLLIEKGMAIKKAVMGSLSIVHPFEKDLSFLYGTIFYGKGHAEGVDSRNVCIFADGEVDRSPTGTGVSGRVALQHARGELAINQPMVIESIVGSRFTASVQSVATYGPHAAVIPEVEGNAHICGKNTFLIDPKDELGQGFFLR